MQKLPIVFLLTSLVLCMSSAAPAYQALDPTEASSDTQIQSLIQFGLDQIVQNGVGKGFFDDGTVFTLSQLNSVAEEIGNGTSYQFDCNFVEASGMKLFAKFTVRVNNASGNNSLASFSYRVTYPPVAVIPGNNTNTTAPAQNNTGEGETTTPPTENNTTVPVTGGETTVTSSSGSDANEFTPITKEEFNQSEALNAIFQFGFAEVVTQGISDNKIPNTLFTHAVINELAYKPTKGGNVYKFSTRASDQKGSDLNMTFEVVQRVSAYKYNVRTVIVSPPTNQTENNTTEPTNPTTPPVNNNTNPETPETPTTPPTNNTEIDEDTQGALSFAINRIMQIGNGNGKIPVGTYSTEVTASSMTGSATSTVYDFSVKLTEAQNKANVTANFTVTVKANGNKILSKYSFRVSYPSKPVTPTTPTTPPVNNTTPEAPTVPPTNTTQPETPVTNTTEPETPVPEPPVTNTTEPETPVPEPPVTEPETPVTNTTEPETPVPEPPVTNTTEPETPVPEPPVVNTTEPEAPVTNTTEPETPATNTTTPPATNSTSSDYITVDPSEVASNQVIQEVINYGIDQVTQIGIKQGKIPNATYTLKTTGAVSKKDSANGTSYKFTVTMENAAKNVLNISATVMNNVKKGTKAVTGFSYNVKNIKA